MNFVLVVFFSLVAFVVYGLGRIALAQRLAYRLTDTIILIPPKERPFLLLLAGTVLGEVPCQDDLPTHLTMQLLRVGVVKMLWRYWKTKRMLFQETRLVGGTR